ncbi:MAG: hypothetical protein BGO77_00115 [Caedibacter sp. 37-49]|nr:MAG: hypothetical protein BGO77_00115 [Caedibacter sp. 37-49]
MNSCWVVTDIGKIGTENQCVGLAEALGFTPEIKRVKPRSIWRLLPASCWFNALQGLSLVHDQLTPPWPDLIIAAGRASVAPTAKIRQLTQGRTKVVQLQNPLVNPQLFDAVIAPQHDNLEGENVIVTEGALHRVTNERLRQEANKFMPMVASLPKPLVVVLIGGSNRCYKVAPEHMKKMGERLKRLCQKNGCGLAVTISRRTEPENRDALIESLKETPAVIWTGEGENPYFGFLGLADYIVVTCDSVSMTSEACFTGKPVYSYFFEGGSTKFNRFHQHFQKVGYTRLFDDTLEKWSYSRLNDWQTVEKQLKKLLKVDL